MQFPEKRLVGSWADAPEMRVMGTNVPLPSYATCSVWPSGSGPPSAPVSAFQAHVIWASEQSLRRQQGTWGGGG